MKTTAGVALFAATLIATLAAAIAAMLLADIGTVEQGRRVTSDAPSTESRAVAADPVAGSDRRADASSSKAQPAAAKGVFR